MKPHDVLYRSMIDQLHTMMREMHDYENEHGWNRETQLLKTAIAMHLTVVLELTEANCIDMLSPADWPTVRNFFTVNKEGT